MLLPQTHRLEHHNALSHPNTWNYATIRQTLSANAMLDVAMLDLSSMAALNANKLKSSEHLSRQKRRLRCQTFHL